MFLHSNCASCCLCRWLVRCKVLVDRPLLAQSMLRMRWTAQIADNYAENVHATGSMQDHACQPHVTISLIEHTLVCDTQLSASGALHLCMTSSLHPTSSSKQAACSQPRPPPQTANHVFKVRLISAAQKLGSNWLHSPSAGTISDMPAWLPNSRAAIAAVLHSLCAMTRACAMHHGHGDTPLPLHRGTALPREREM
jgi:hypothetical protein